MLLVSARQPCYTIALRPFKDVTLVKKPTQNIINNVCVVLAATVLFFCAANTVTGTVVTATVSFSLTNAGLVLNPAFNGLSYDKSELTGSLFVTNDSSMIQMFSQIGPAVLRVGADSVDTTCWGGLSNTTPITPGQVDAFAAFVKALPQLARHLWHQYVREHARELRRRSGLCRQCAGVQPAWLRDWQ